MYHYGDEKMDFLDAVLIAKHRTTEYELDKYFAPDIALAIKTIINGLDAENKKTEECGYIKGYIAAEKDKDKVIEKILSDTTTEKYIHNDSDFCEWYEINKNTYICHTHAETYDSRVLDWCVCPYCGKSIKIKLSK